MADSFDGNLDSFFFIILRILTGKKHLQIKFQRLHEV